MTTVEYSTRSFRVRFTGVHVVFGINILDEPDECISVQENEFNGPTRKRGISDD